MERYAIIKNDIVITVALADDPAVFAGRGLALKAFPWTQPGDVLAEGQLPPAPAPVIPTLAQARASAVAAVKEKSWQAETAGILVQGTRIPTDRESQNLLAGAVVGALLDPDHTLNWQTDSLTPDDIPLFIPLSATELKLIAQAARAHVQACFDARKDKFAALAALDSVEEIEAWLAENLESGWPATAPPVTSKSGPEPEAAVTSEIAPEPAPLAPPVTAAV